MAISDFQFVGMRATYYVAVPFDRTESGHLKPGQAEEWPTAHGAVRRAHSLAFRHAGAVAFSRTGDLATGEFRAPTILGKFGEAALQP